MLPCATENKRLWLRGPHGSSCVRRFFTWVHRQLSSLVERNHVEHPRPDFRHRIFAIIDHRLKYCNRSDPCLNSPREGGEKMDATNTAHKGDGKNERTDFSTKSMRFSNSSRQRSRNKISFDN